MKAKLKTELCDEKGTPDIYNGKGLDKLANVKIQMPLTYLWFHKCKEKYLNTSNRSISIRHVPYLKYLHTPH